jgi:hypothetical protein
MTNDYLLLILGFVGSNTVLHVSILDADEGIILKWTFKQEWCQVMGWTELMNP